MSEPRRSTRTRTREELAPETPKETPSKITGKSSLKRKRTSVVTKDSTPATPITETSQQVPKHVLPIKLVEGQSLPTLPEPQALDLQAHEYQDIQQSGVLSASLQRSRAVWTSGSNFRLFHALFTPPKKVADRSEEDKQNMQRQKEIVRNFPQVGGSVEALLVIEPHTFPIRFYGPREMVRAAQKKAPTYGQWPNHNQYSPYQQYNNAPAAYAKPTLQQRPTQPKPAPPKSQIPPPRLNTAPAPRVNQTPAPDPVIHMLAQRAGTDPELKAVMKIVAAGHASKEQLEFFQSHISELTNILQKQKEAAAKTQSLHPPPPPPPPPQLPQPPPQSQSRPQPQPLPPPPLSVAATASLPRPPVVQPTQPLQAPPKPFLPPNTMSYTQMAPVTPSQPPYSNPYTPTYSQHQHTAPYGPASHPQRPTYRPLVFDFLEGNGDKFYFPSYSFMEWLPNNQGVKFSFIVTKMKLKPKAVLKDSTPSTPAPKGTLALVPTLVTTPNTLMSTNSHLNTPTPIPSQTTAPTSAVTPYIPPPRIEDFDEMNDIKDIEFYQPVTIIVLTNHYEILQALPRAVRPPDNVEKYMNEVFDTCRRAEETYLAFRLPKEGVVENESEEKRMKENTDVTPAIPTIPDVVMGAPGILEKKRTAGRPRKSLM